MEWTPGNYYNFHPGSHVGQGAEAGVRMIAEMLNEVLTEDQSTTVLLETMSGKGTESRKEFRRTPSDPRPGRNRRTRWESVWIPAMSGMEAMTS